VAGAQVVLVGAEPVVYLERSGKGLLTLVEEHDPRLHPALEALADHVRAGRVRRIGIERVNGEPVAGSPLAAVLIELGFRQSPRALTLTA
jgi:ATP-dependent Lhr-like helicase